MRNIIVVDNKAYIRNKIKELLADYKINVHEAISSMQFFTLIAHLNYDVDLIILEINLGSESGLEIVSKLNSKGCNIPILILTTENRKKQFTKGIKAGVIDYMLKPFNDKVLVDRIIENIKDGKSKVAQRKALCQGKRISLDSIKEAAAKAEEIKNKIEARHEENKSKKEVMHEEIVLSMIMITFFKKVEEFTLALEKEYKNIGEILYPHLKDALEVSDLLTKYGFQSFIAAYKGIDKTEKGIIEDKIRDVFINIREKHPELKQYYLECVFVNYPEDGKNKEELILKARQRMVEKINSIKRTEKQWI